MDDAQTTENAPAAGAKLNDGDSDGSSEWEYEYSTTEAETHLVTLDLSIPEFLGPRDEHIVHNNRGAFRQWMTTFTSGDETRSKQAVVQKRVTFGKQWEDADDEEGDGVEGDEGFGEEDNDREDELGGTLGGASGHSEDKNSTGRSRATADDTNVTSDTTDAKEIQILELHSDNPVIAYRGRVFTGSWTENIGTEMLFTEHSDDDHSLASMLPGVLQLPQNARLLGASSARIACTPVEVVRQQKSAGGEEEVLSVSRARQQLGFTIPVYRNASEQRKKQATFLENLMAIKHRRGETDVVTVQALETRQNAVPGGADDSRENQDDEGRVQKRARLDDDGEDGPAS